MSQLNSLNTMKQTLTQENENNQPCPQQIISVAKEIINVLKLDVRLPMSWGMSKLIAISFKNMPALMFKVNGFLHRGQVVVALNEGMDLYEIFILGNSGRINTHIQEVYVDQLTEILDRLIETTEPNSQSYQNQIVDWLGKV